MSSTTASTTQTSFERDLEAQTPTVVVGRYEPGPSTYIVLPPPAVAHSLRTSTSVEQGTDPIDAFFGVSRSPRGTQDSRHDDRHLVAYQDDVPPPPYADATDLPSYTSVAEPPTLAMYLFKFGFLFPLFWLAGLFVLLCPLTPPENWEPTKTEAERQELLGLLRRTEVKWARRSLIALSLFSLIAIAAALTAFFVMRS
ncbi:hypothetical protein BC835DRAFT_1368612 [Cytidiella melzeri]|nr:hypothetical protein BC835DRAFT_1368612 [Cytidiella melzeri]